MKYYIYLLTFLSFFSSCTKNNDITENDIPLPAATILDTAYGTDPLQEMDIYLPAGRDEHTRTIVLVHGGSWAEGDKSELTPSIENLQELFPGYAIANINYRLAKNGQTNIFPTQEEDVKKAVETVTANAGNFHISRDLILAGFSAGGHLVLLHGYKNDPEKHVKAIVDFFGPTDLTVLSDKGSVQALILFNATGKTYDQDAELFLQSSPVHFVTGNSPPTIILQGGADDLVPASQSAELDSKLEENNVAHELVVYPEEGHGWGGITLADSFDKIKKFLAANLPD